MIDWIIEMTSKWEKEETTPSSPIIAFTLRLLSLLTENEWQFVALKEKEVLDRFVYFYILQLFLSYKFFLLL